MPRAIASVIWTLPGAVQGTEGGDSMCLQGVGKQVARLDGNYLDVGHGQLLI